MRKSKIYRSWQGGESHPLVKALLLKGYTGVEVWMIGAMSRDRRGWRFMSQQSSADYLGHDLKSALEKIKTLEDAQVQSNVG